MRWERGSIFLESESWRFETSNPEGVHEHYRQMEAKNRGLGFWFFLPKRDMFLLSTSSPHRRGCDLVLQINNSSKRQLPDFGTGDTAPEIRLWVSWSYLQTSDGNNRRHVLLRNHTVNIHEQSFPPWTGRCEKAMTNAGPTLFLPTKGGMEAVLPCFAQCSRSSCTRTIDKLKMDSCWWLLQCFMSMRLCALLLADV